MVPCGDDSRDSSLLASSVTVPGKVPSMRHRRRSLRPPEPLTRGFPGRSRAGTTREEPRARSERAPGVNKGHDRAGASATRAQTPASVYPAHAAAKVKDRTARETGLAVWALPREELSLAVHIPPCENPGRPGGAT